jgi:hypothetical protein
MSFISQLQSKAVLKLLQSEELLSVLRLGVASQGMASISLAQSCYIASFAKKMVSD